MKRRQTTITAEIRPRLRRINQEIRDKNFIKTLNILRHGIGILLESQVYLNLL